MATGTVVHYNESQGKGRIAPDQGSVPILFVHQDVAAEGFTALNSGDRVTFETALRGSGLVAVDIHLL